MSQNMPMPQQPVPPFRKRRPFVFWTLLLFGLLVLLSVLSRLGSAAGERGLFSGPRLAVINLEGMILDSNDVVEWADRLRRDRTVVGVLLRINSPGGAVTPSQEMYRAVKRLADSGKPVVVSMGTVAASGGYYVAMAARELYASPATLTGSIGVKLQTPNVEGLMDRLGIKAETLTTGKLKDAGSPYRAMSEDEKKYLGGLIADMQDDFVQVVAAGRKLPQDEVLRLADGRAFTGRQALQAKLIDHLGDKEDALLRLTMLAGLPERPKTLLEGPKKDVPLWKRMISSLMEMDRAASLAVPNYGFYYF